MRYIDTQVSPAPYQISSLPPLSAKAAMSGSVPSIISARRLYCAWYCVGSWLRMLALGLPSTRRAAAVTAMWLNESGASKLVPNMYDCQSDVDAPPRPKRG